MSYHGRRFLPVGSHTIWHQAHFRHTKIVKIQHDSLVLVCWIWYNKYIKNLEKQGFFKGIPMAVKRPFNRSVVGSSPTGGAKENDHQLMVIFVFPIFFI